MSSNKKKVPFVIVQGAVYKQAQLQELLQQYETATGKLLSESKNRMEQLAQINAVLENAQKAGMGKNFSQANALIKKLEGVLGDEATNELMELVNTMAGVAGLEGSN